LDNFASASLPSARRKYRPAQTALVLADETIDLFRRERRKIIDIQLALLAMADPVITQHQIQNREKRHEFGGSP
jgi:hypothetical protein